MEKEIKPHRTLCVVHLYKIMIESLAGYLKTAENEPERNVVVLLL